MSDVWTIKGQTGKAIGTAARTFPQLRVEGMQIRFLTLAAGTATWTVWLKTAAEIPQYVPDSKQVISIYLNGDRYFTGHVTGRKPLFSSGRWGYSITVSDAWYWLDKEPLTSEIPDETTVVQERAIYLFDVGSPTEHLVSLATRAIEVGMPIALGTFATCNDVPRLSLRDMSYSDAFSEIMRLVVDGHLYLDHSGPDGTYPLLCMQRRALASTIEISPDLLAVDELNLTPREDLQISAVKVAFAARATHDGKRVTAFKEQIAGTATGEIPDRQLITVTGPEISLSLPQDLTDSVVVQSAVLDGSIGNALSVWHDLLKAGEASIAGLTVYTSAQSDTAAGTTTYWPTDPLILATDSEGKDLDLNEWTHYLTKGEVKDWFEKDGIPSIQARITATVASTVVAATTDPAPEDYKWARVLGATRTSHFIIESGTLKVRYVWQATVSAVVPLVKTSWATETTLIRQEDWGWFHPPAGFADYLLETQNWIPWEGEVPIATDDTPPHNAVGSVLNILGWVPEAATMRAMISGYSVTPRTGEITYTLGPPMRHAYRDLVNRFRQSGADNIYWLGTEGGPGPGGPPDGSILDEDGSNYEINEDGSTYPTTEDA